MINFHEFCELVVTSWNYVFCEMPDIHNEALLMYLCYWNWICAKMYVNIYAGKITYKAGQ